MTRATTRVKSLGLKQGLKILIVDGDGENTDTISNVVYHEVFRNVSWLLKSKPFLSVFYNIFLYSNGYRINEHDFLIFTLLLLT